MNHDKSVAIIGLAGRFPRANTAEDFWDVLISGRSATSPPPADRREIAHWQDVFSIHAGFLDAVAQFDAGFFRISPRDAAAMDPQQRLFLQTVWHAIENAGYTPETLPRRTGIFVAAISGDYATLCDPRTLTNAPPFRAVDRYQIANRVSYHLDFTGPSVTLDTACSGSCVAMHMAIQALEYGDCEVAIVGGVNLFLHASRFAQYRAQGILSDDNTCRPFREGANGVVYGEGVGAVVIRPALAAERNGDLVRAYVAGSSVNSSGHTQGFSVPSSRAQTDVVSTALARADVAVLAIGAVESHGTGTALGDPIEARGIADVFRKATLAKDPAPVSLGTLKGHFGHLESAATIAAITKVVLQMEHRQLAQSLPDAPQNRLVSFKRTPLILQDKLEDWPVSTNADRRYALITSIGGGGVNASLVLAETVMPVPRLTAPYGTIFIFSARTPEQLRAVVLMMLDWLDRHGEACDMDRLATTLQIGRVALTERVAFEASNPVGIQQAMLNWLKNRTTTDLTGPAADWVNGMDVDWTNGRTRSELPRILPLPGYPFGGKSYWLSTPEDVVSDSVPAE